ncbi:hypothetical protein GW17_00051186 [Ensete ventricosum]|nr:hypothetical protein GW17_00051186 [Ensete ventricosum]
MVNLNIVRIRARHGGRLGFAAKAPTSIAVAQSSLEVQEVRVKAINQKAPEAPRMQVVEAMTHPRKKMKTFDRHKSWRDEGDPNPILQRARNRMRLWGDPDAPPRRSRSIKELCQTSPSEGDTGFYDLHMFDLPVGDPDAPLEAR